MNICEPFIRRPVMTSLLMLAILLFGIVGYRNLAVSDLPNVDFPTIQVSAGLPGASPETMASSVATPLEKQFTTIAGLDSMTSTSSLGSTQITLQFDLSRNIDSAALDVQSAISAASRQLPPNMPSPPTFRKVNPADSPIFLLAVTSPTLPLYDVDKYAENLIAEQSSMVPGLAQVAAFGAAKYAVRVHLDPQALASRQIGIDQVTEAGGVPVLLPPVPGVATAIARLDALVLTGGGDVDPANYGAAAGPRTARVHPERDQAELELLAAALAAGLPVLGICRGMQLLNVARGGTLCQHLPAEAGHTPTPGTFGSHQVRLAPGSQLASILRPGNGADPAGLAVPTAHHQAIDRLGEGLVASAWAPDGVIEAVELPSGEGQHPFTLAVQWHPEAGEDRRLVSALVAAAAGG